MEQVISSSDGGKLQLVEIGASLVFPTGSIFGDHINASLATCSEDDFPPLKPDQIVMSMVLKCGPSGEKFKTPAVLEMPHSGNIDENESNMIEVWYKSPNPSKFYFFLSHVMQHIKKWGGEPCRSYIYLSFSSYQIMVYVSHVLCCFQCTDIFWNKSSKRLEFLFIEGYRHQPNST